MTGYITWDVSPIIFDSFITLRWYSLAFMIGFLVGYEIVARMFKHEGAPEKWLGILLIWVVCATIVGSRLGHVFFYEWDVYRLDPIKILYVWEGGLASHGGTIGIILAVILFSVFTTHRSPLWTFDRLVVPVQRFSGMPPPCHGDSSSYARPSGTGSTREWRATLPKYTKHWCISHFSHC